MFRGAIAISGLGLILAGLLAAPVSAAAAPSYVAVIDAGSSGTRLSLFGEDPSTVVPREVTKARTNTKGLSSFAANPNDAGAQAISPLLAQLDEYLDSHGIAKADVPIALLATAGMRNVRRDNPSAAREILISTGASILASGHPLADNQILPAFQEATLAWLDSNALAGTLSTRVGSVGIVEVGGASAQVAFRSAVSKGPAVHIVRVDGQAIPVVAVSYLGLGGNDARTSMQATHDAGSFCFPNNGTGRAPDTYVTSSPRPVRASTAHFSWNRCASAFAGTITTVGKDRTSAAPFAPSTLRTLPGFTSSRFIGLGSLPFTYSDLGITQAKDDKASLREATTATCSGADAWNKVLALFNGRSSAFADVLCATGTYQYEFLFGQEGVGVNPKRFTTDDAGLSRTPAWTSGYAIGVLNP